ncbi:MBL fold metallo-hydrolase [Arthrobacter sp. StoSoilB22]|uniref:MBL fold metallo-hydrolase n=1 Tax=Arthrobacter sp. StoSoilB22 TaxID=2830996 RepID=UPI001CC51F57|nr:MBL fold metallo-hydrolase [Arthrobacter sp. StoSoilB22]BCW62927.1 MBL fold metallo-hydrolase [Arthrobacter sp. StoSoilB22]
MSNENWKIGAVQVTKIVESVSAHRAEDLFPGSSSEVVSQNREWLHPHFIDNEDKLFLSIHSLCIEADGKKIVVDTCIGNETPEPYAAIAIPGSKYLDDLEAIGFKRDEVDFVVCTHLHIDHVGWNTMRQGEKYLPTFPNARYLFTEPAVSGWKEQVPFEVASFGTLTTIQPLLDAGVIDAVPTDYRITDSIRLESTPGHSRGHVSVHIESGGEHALITGDITHHPVQWAELGWGQVSDVDVEESTATRKRILEEYADKEVLLIGTHYPSPTAGHLVSTPQGGRFVPLKD